MKKFVKLYSVMAEEAVITLLKNGIVRADSGKRMFEEENNKELAHTEKVCYDYIAEHTPGCKAGVYPLWAWMTKPTEEIEDGYILVEIRKEKNKCCKSSFMSYSEHFGYDSVVTPEWDNMFNIDWRVRMDTQVTFADLNINEVYNIEEVKAKLGI